MKIEYFGHSCFRVTSENGVRWVSDPYTQVGYELPKDFFADFVTVSHGHFDHNYVDGVKDIKHIFNTIEDFSYNGAQGSVIKCFHDDKKGALRGENLIFKVDIDGVIFCHLGDLGELCSDALINKIGKVNVLMVPIGGRYTIDAKQAKEYINALQPNVIIPMHYKPMDGTINITDATDFLNSIDKKHLQYVGKELTIDKHTLLSEKLKVLYMEK